MGKIKSIAELSKVLNISKEAIYKKTKNQLKQELKSHIFKKNGKILIDEKGEEIIRQSIHKDSSSACKEKTYENKNSVLTNIESKFQVENQVENQEKTSNLIEFLKKEIEEKNKQIQLISNNYFNQLKEKDKQIEQLINLNNRTLNTFENEQKIQVAETLHLQENSDNSDDMSHIKNASKRGRFWSFFTKQ